METIRHHILLADDDTDDCLFFEEALKELPVEVMLSMVNDGVELMDLLSKKKGDLPDVLFLDLNMPLKNGFECLSEIKRDNLLKKLPVIIFSTSFDKDAVKQLYDYGAHYYIRKPSAYSAFKQMIHRSLNLISQNSSTQPGKEMFVLNAL